MVWASEDAFPVSVPVGGYFHDLLEELGDRAKLKVVEPGEYFSQIYGTPQRAQIAFTGWTSDYAAPSGFIVPLFSCGGSNNATGFCDPDLDQRIEDAGRLQTSDPAGAGDVWSEIERELVDQAPWVPLGNAYWANLVSQRLGNYQATAPGGPLIDQLWVR
jgi:peptide/nickel transport system substrate-binding protein